MKLHEMIMNFLIMSLVVFFFGGLLIYLGWNFGMSPAFDLKTIGFFPCCWISLLITIVTHIPQFRSKREEEE